MIGLVVALTFAQSQPPPFLHAFALESGARGPIDWSTATLEVTPRDARAAQAEFLTRRKVRPVAGVFRVTRLEEPALLGPVVARHRKASWVIDFDQPAFAASWDTAVAELGARPSVDAVTRFVAGYLTTKSYDRGFDLASTVASRRRGDCSEHAVFLAALLRRFGIPARAVAGLVLLPTTEAPLAMGHMWVEAFVGDRWRVADAAVPREAGAAYLPAGELADEGPGYALSLAALVTSLSFERLTLVTGSRADGGAAPGLPGVSP